MLLGCVERWLGTRPGAADTGALVTKMTGNYNIVDNVLNFVEAPFGNTPIGSTTNPPDERDFDWNYHRFFFPRQNIHKIWYYW